MRVLVNIITYNRPRLLAQLLSDFHEQDRAVDIHIHDDCSNDADYEPIRQYAKMMPRIRYLRARRRHGKHDHYRMINGVFEVIRYTPKFDLSIHLPDDVRLCDGFVERCVSMWRRHESLRPTPIAINLLRDHRDNCWTKTQLLITREVRRTGWIDGCFVCTREYYEALGWQLQQPPIQARADGLGTGVYRGISEKLEPRLYQTMKSLVVHVPAPSRMHPELRAATPIDTENFVDGNERKEQLCQEALSVCS